MADALTGKQLREYVKSGKPVYLSPSYDSRYWLVEWTNKEEILQLADMLEERERLALDKNAEFSDFTLAVEFVEDEELLTINMSFD